jgi:hypothetical protein
MDKLQERTDRTGIRLSENEVKQFHERGYPEPFTAVSEEEMVVIRDRLDQEVLTTPGPSKGSSTSMRHLDKKLIYDLVTHPADSGAGAGRFGPEPTVVGMHLLVEGAGRERGPLASGFELLVD